MPLNPEQQNELLDAMYSSLQEQASELGTIYTTQWNVRNDISRTLLTISSAILVISISLSSHITTHKWILGVCWAAFLLTILSGVASLWFSLGLYTFPAFVINGRKEIRERVKDFEVATVREEASAIIDDLIGPRLDQMERFDRLAIKSLKACLTMFIVGLLCTGVVGWEQLRATPETPDRAIQSPATKSKSTQTHRDLPIHPIRVGEGWACVNG